MIIQNTSLCKQHCGLQANAADLHVPLQEGCGTDEQEHHDTQAIPGHLENNPALEKPLSLTGEFGPYVHQGGPH